MNSLLYFSLFLSIIFLQTSMAARHHQNNNLIIQTCKITPYYNLCVSTLKSDPKSSQADVAGLALIIVEKLKSNSIVAMNQIKRLKAANPGLGKPLSMCRRLYNTILVGCVAEAEQALEYGDPKFGETGMIDAGNEASRCESEFSGMKSPLTDLNTAVNHLALVAVPMIRLLL